MLKLSCCISNGYQAICLIKDGTCVVRDVRCSEEYDNRFSESLNLFTRAFGILGAYVEKSDESEVVIETKNKTIVKWMQQGYSTEKYNDEFIHLLEELNNIPVAYCINYNSDLISKRFANKNYLNKVELSSMTLDESEDIQNESVADGLSIEFRKDAKTDTKLSGIADFL